MTSRDPARTQQARIAALTRSSREPSGAAMTAKARRTWLDSFYEKTDPDLPEEERQRQARADLQAEMIRRGSAGGAATKRRRQQPASRIAAPNADAV